MLRYLNPRNWFRKKQEEPIRQIEIETLRTDVLLSKRYSHREELLRACYELLIDKAVNDGYFKIEVLKNHPHNNEHAEMTRVSISIAKHERV